MINNAAFRRKVIYLGLIALALIPLYVVGHPAVGDPLDTNSSRGGRLAQLRADHDLSPAEIGEIDPTSESMKLATLGMRGLAATILCSKANDYKKKENWEGLVAVVNQLTKLQPNFISVWEFQSHNLSYNISVEQDDYRFRYLWVKKGIEFLIRGTHYNRREPRLFWNVGWYTGQKLNRSDESKQFRRMFKVDQDFHAIEKKYIDLDGDGRGADGKPDSWLASRLWYNRAYDIVDTQGQMVRGKTPHIFYADGPKALMNYANAIEDEGYLDERAEYAWRRAGEEWDRYGARQVPASNGLVFRLNDEESRHEESLRLIKELDELVPGGREAVERDKIARLSPAERKAYETDDKDLKDAETYQAKIAANLKVVPTHIEVADRAPANMKARAHRLAQQADEAALYAEWIDRYRQNVNFEYWRTRCRVEQLSDTVAARRHIYQANQFTEKVEVDAARQEYEKAWDLWAKVFEANPVLVESLSDDDLIEYIEKYQKVLSILDQRLPPDFKLRKLLEKRGKLPPELATSGSESTSPTDASADSTKKSEPSKPASETSTSTQEPAKDPSTAKKDESTADSTKKEEEPKKEEAKKEEPAKEELKKDEVKKDEPKKDEPAKEEPKAGTAAKEEPKGDEPKKEESAKEESRPDEAKLN